LEIASGDTAVLEVVWKGKHTGPLRTPAGVIAASQKPDQVPACQVIQVKDGKVASFSHYFDFLTLLRHAADLRSQFGYRRHASASRP